MAIRPILYIPDPRLKMVAEPVAEITDEIRKQVKDMFDTMYEAPSIGLAAPQIGVMNRVVVVDCARRAEELGEEGPIANQAEIDEASAEPDPIVLINPEIIWFSDELRLHEEGCLSIPEYYAEVERPATLRVRFLDRAGKPQEIDAGGVLATCIQHEIDHLDGKLFIDYLSKLKRDMVIRKFTKQAKLAPKPASL